MESPRPSVMLVCAGGSKRNGGVQSGEFPLKVHDSTERCFKVQWARIRERRSGQCYGGNDS